MAKFNISQAARVTGKARSTIQAHLKNGKLSADFDGVGKCLIDAAELQRVYGVLGISGKADVVKEVTEKVQGTIKQDTALMQQKIEFLEEKVRFFQRQLEYEPEEKEKLLVILESQTKQITDQRKRKWWF